MSGVGRLLQIGSYLLVHLVLELHWGQLLLQPLEDCEESRNHEDLTDSTEQPTTYGGSTQGLVTILTYTCCEHQRQQTDNHRQRGHQDRTETGTGTQDS